ITTPEHRAAAGRVRELLAAYERAEDLINIGAYQRGSNSRIDEAIANHDAIIAYLRQDRDEAVDFDTAVVRLLELAGNARTASLSD
ncbi:hypothetical protein OFC63_32320, partial [Escherichia coli]|nr:hypothetical protein [Escherichia coli]